MADPTTFQPKVEDGVLVIQLTNTEYFEPLTLANFRNELLEYLNPRLDQRVLVDFNEVRHFGSEAVGLLVQVAKRLRLNGGDLRLCSMGGVVKEIFDICRLIPSVFELHPSVGEGIEAFSAAKQQ